MIKVAELVSESETLLDEAVILIKKRLVVWISMDLLEELVHIFVGIVFENGQPLGNEIVSVIYQLVEVRVGLLQRWV